jgi:hypothetical protein
MVTCTLIHGYALKVGEELTMTEETVNNKLPDIEGESSEYKVGNKHPPKEYQFKPGQSGNPAGRPKDPGITAIQKKMLDEVCPYATEPGQTWREWLAVRGLTLASERDSALEHLKERLEGKVAVEAEGKLEVTYRVIYDDRNPES